MIRIFAAALLCLVAIPAQATPIPCWQVKAAVRVVGEAKAEALAAKHGYTPAEIAEARKCLK